MQLRAFQALNDAMAHEDMVDRLVFLLNYA